MRLNYEYTETRKKINVQVISLTAECILTSADSTYPLSATLVCVWAYCLLQSRWPGPGIPDCCCHHGSSCSCNEREREKERDGRPCQSTIQGEPLQYQGYTMRQTVLITSPGHSTSHMHTSLNSTKISQTLYQNLFI